MKLVVRYIKDCISTIKLFEKNENIQIKNIFTKRDTVGQKNIHGFLASNEELCGASGKWRTTKQLQINKCDPEENETHRSSKFIKSKNWLEDEL